jgi:hypothetical protein
LVAAVLYQLTVLIQYFLLSRQLVVVLVRVLQTQVAAEVEVVLVEMVEQPVLELLVKVLLAVDPEAVDTKLVLVAGLVQLEKRVAELEEL